MAHGGSAALGELVGPELAELLRTHGVSVRRPVWGRRHGQHASARGGLGLDFRDHRAYVPGDDPRQLDWRAVARRDRLVLRQTEAEDDLPIVIAVDAGGNMGYGEGRQTKYRVAAGLATAIAWAGVRQGDAVGLACGGEGDLDTGLLRVASGQDRIDAIARKLVAAPLRGRMPWRRLLPAMAARLPRRSLVVVCSDFLDPAEADADASAVEAEIIRGLASIRARRHDVVMLQVLHPDELEFPWDDRRLLRFVDRRGLRPTLEGTGAALRRGYLERLEAHQRRLADEAERNGLVLERVRTDAPLLATFVGLLGRLAGQPAVAGAIAP